MTKAKKKEAAEETSMAVVEGQEVAVDLYDYGDDAGQGMSAESKADIKMPFIIVLQTQSPQCKPEKKGGLGCTVGNLFNTVSEKEFEKMNFVVAKADRCFVEWVPREDGGGFAGQHPMDSGIVAAAKKRNVRKHGKSGPYILENGNELEETQYLHVVEVDDAGEPTGAFASIAFKSTKLSQYRNWNSKVQMFTVPNARTGGKVSPPVWAHLTSLSTVEESNTHGDYYNFVLSPTNGSFKNSLIPPTHPAYIAAKNLAEMVESGVASADHDSMASSGGDNEEYDPNGEDEPF